MLHFIQESRAHSFSIELNKNFCSYLHTLYIYTVTFFCCDLPPNIRIRVPARGSAGNFHARRATLRISPSVSPSLLCPLSPFVHCLGSNREKFRKRRKRRDDRRRRKEGAVSSSHALLATPTAAATIKLGFRRQWEVKRTNAPLLLRRRRRRRLLGERRRRREMSRRRSICHPDSVRGIDLGMAEAMFSSSASR